MQSTIECRSPLVPCFALYPASPRRSLHRSSAGTRSPAFNTTSDPQDPEPKAVIRVMRKIAFVPVLLALALSSCASEEASTSSGDAGVAEPTIGTLRGTIAYAGAEKGP